MTAFFPVTPAAIPRPSDVGSCHRCARLQLLWDSSASGECKRNLTFLTAQRGNPSRLPLRSPRLQTIREGTTEADVGVDYLWASRLPLAVIPACCPLEVAPVARLFRYPFRCRKVPERVGSAPPRCDLSHHRCNFCGLCSRSPNAPRNRGTPAGQPTLRSRSCVWPARSRAWR